MSVSSAATTVSKLSGLYKEVYGSRINDLTPEQVRVMKLVDFSQAERIGNYFHQPVIVSELAGFTASAAAQGAFSLLDPVSLQMADAQVQSSQVVGRASFDYETAERSATSAAAFEKSAGLIVRNLKKSFSKLMEVQMMYGGTGLGTIGSITAATTTADIVFTDATWAPGIWVGKRNMQLDFYRSTVQINSNAAVVITAIDVDNKTISVSGNQTDIGNLAAGDVAYFYGFYGSEAYGLDKIITNATTLYNINSATYPDVWKGNIHDCGNANLTLSKLMKGLAKAANRGLEDAKVTCLVSNSSFSDLNSDMAALRKFDGSYSPKNAENGFRTITLYSNVGELMVVPSIYVKEGEAFAFSPDDCKRIGSTDITFNLPGQPSESVFFPMASNAGVEIRAYTSQTMFMNHPSWAVKFTGIVNNS